jgi:peptide-methionine (S)-S-oxide reductase
MRLLCLLKVPLVFVAVGGPLTTTAAFVPSVPTAKWTSSSRLRAKKEATFGMGCFWKPAEELSKLDGVLETAAGYTGHPNANKVPPSYDDVCFSREWVEGVRVVYDDDKVSYAQLLDAFFQAQEPKVGSRQYSSIIFPHDQEQQEAAETWLQQGRQSNRVRSDGLPVAVTQLEAKSPFFKAEGYHQNYWQKFRPRVATVVALIALSMVDLNQYVTADVASIIERVAGWGLYAIGAWVLLERVVDAKVVELE